MLKWYLETERKGSPASVYAKKILGDKELPCVWVHAHLQTQKGFSASLQLRILLQGTDATTPTTSLWSKMQWKNSGNPSGKPGTWGWLKCPLIAHQIVTPAQDWVPQKAPYLVEHLQQSSGVYWSSTAQIRPSTSQGARSCLTARGRSAPGPKLRDRTRVRDCRFGPFILSLSFINAK